MNWQTPATDNVAVDYVYQSLKPSSMYPAGTFLVIAYCNDTSGNQSPSCNFTFTLEPAGVFTQDESSSSGGWSVAALATGAGVGAGVSILVMVLTLVVILWIRRQRALMPNDVNNVTDAMRHARTPSLVDDAPASNPAQYHHAQTRKIENNDAPNVSLEMQFRDESVALYADVSRDHANNDQGNSDNTYGYVTVNGLADKDADKVETGNSDITDGYVTLNSLDEAVKYDKLGQAKKHLTDSAQDDNVTYSAPSAQYINIDDAPDGFGFFNNESAPINKVTDIGSQVTYEEPALSMYSSITLTPADELNMHCSPNKKESDYLRVETAAGGKDE